MGKLTAEQRQARRQKRRDNMKKFFQKVAAWFKNLGQNINEFLQTHVEPAINFLQVIKTIVDNPALDFITAATKTKVDDNLLPKLRLALSTAIDVLEVQLSCGAEASVEDKIACYIEYLRGLPPEVRKAMYHKTASVIARITGKEFDLDKSEVDYWVQHVYTQIKNNNQ